MLVAVCPWSLPENPSLTSQPLGPTQPPILRRWGTSNGLQTVAVVFGQEDKHRSGIAPVICLVYPPTGGMTEGREISTMPL